MKILSTITFAVLSLFLFFSFFACDDDDDNDDSVDDDSSDDDTSDDDSSDDDTGDDDDTTDDDTSDDDDTGPDDMYVSVNGDDANPGTQSEPKQTITAGVGLVATGGTVHVAAGTYAESVSVSGVSLLGGYEDGGWTRDIAANQTSIEGLVDQPALTITGASTKEVIEVSGFSIQGNGSTASAYGVKILDGANATFSDNIVTAIQNEISRQKDSPVEASYGVFLTDSTVVFTRNELNGNNGAPTSFLSYALRGERSTVEITDNVIYGGSAGGGYAWGVYLLDDSAGSIINNDIDGGIASSQYNATAVFVYENQPMIITGNAIYGGEGASSNGLVLESSYVTVINNMIDGGNGTEGSTGLYIHQRCCSASVVNNSIFGGNNNRTRAVSDRQLVNSNDEDVFLVNNILHAGTGDPDSMVIFLTYQDNGDYSKEILINNDFYDPDGDCLVMDHDVCLDDIAEVNACEFEGCVEASGNISAQPQWVSADDFHLTAGSLCIDAGIDPAPWYDGDLADYDFDGDPRPSGTGWDIGADEVIPSLLP